MKKMLLVALAALLGLGLVGCSPATRSVVEPMVDPKTGAVMKDDKGNVLTKTSTIPAENDFYDAQGRAMLPIFEFRAPKDKDVSFPAGSELVVRVPGQVKQYVPESVQVIRELAPIARDGILVNGIVELGKKAVDGARGHEANITNNGDGNNASFAGGNGGDQTTGAIAKNPQENVGNTVPVTEAATQ